MSFNLTPEARTAEWQRRIAAFIDEAVIPAEQQAFEHGVTDPLRSVLQSRARDAGVWAPTASVEFGGGGFAFDQVAVLLEEAGTSLLGPLALNCAAPDEGNMHLLERVASAAQKERFLRPLVDGAVRSCFAMTEPPPGAGSDPSALQTVATRTGTGWRINGQKYLITGAEGAEFAIVMTRDADTGQSTMFLVDMGQPGVSIDGHIRTIDATTVGGHCRLSFTDVEVGEDAVLGEVGQGFRYAQVRLAPARLTHCMRWLGAARRAHEIALARSIDRELFGAALSSLGMAQQMIADNEIELVAARSLLWHAATRLAGGEKGTVESSRAKVFISEATSRIVDRSVQLAGGMGTSDELVIGRIYADIRAFRIYDGSSETHRMSIAKSAVRDATRRTAGDHDSRTTGVV